MSNTRNVKSEQDASEVKSLEWLISHLREVAEVGNVLALVDCEDVQISAVVLDETVKGGGYVDERPLGHGMFLVVGLNLPTKFKTGINEILVGKQEVSQ